MRKQPLIVLSAFVALGASIIVGASTGSFKAVPTSARIRIPAAQVTARTKHQKVGHLTVTKTAPIPRQVRDLVVFHDPFRPAHLRLSSVTGLPVVHKAKHKHKHKHRRHAVVPARTTTTIPPTTVPPTTVPPTTVPPTTVPSTSTAGGVWYELRMCESGGDYSINTGNGFYGAYQFALSTWLGLGFSGLPSDAPPAVQDRAAQELQARSGWGQWPACSAKLGL